MKYLLHSFLLASVMTGCNAQVAYEIDHEIQQQIDAFAIEQLDKAQARSIRDNIEYCGLIGLNHQQALVATKVVPGQRDSCNLTMELDPHFIVLASFHTHGAYSLDSDAEVPSMDDLIGDIEEGTDGYISTPAGRVWVNRFQDEQSYLLCGVGCVLADPNYEPCQAFLPDDSYDLDSLQRRADNDPGYC